MPLFVEKRARTTLATFHIITIRRRQDGSSA